MFKIRSKAGDLDLNASTACRCLLERSWVHDQAMTLGHGDGLVVLGRRPRKHRDAAMPLLLWRGTQASIFGVLWDGKADR